MIVFSIISAGDAVDNGVLIWIEYAAILIEVLAVLIIVSAIVAALMRYGAQRLSGAARTIRIMISR
jgi:hypothetical protein